MEKTKKRKLSSYDFQYENKAYFNQCTSGVSPEKKMSPEDFKEWYNKTKIDPGNHRRFIRAYR